MTMSKKFRSYAMGLGLISAALIVDGWLPVGFVIKDAQAVFGRPLTPISVAGVARRTIRRTAVYAATLPRGCSTVLINGTTLHQSRPTTSPLVAATWS